ncbi:MAG TPA: NAD(P)H-binding protein, partial [Miltoncostaeaceae bacterium]|nr:NAD(P)H-binding protein [Miltoncostaeaceae bacterium]
MTDPLVLLTGPTGYIGGRLLAALQERGVRVRCLTRRPEALHDLGPRTEVVRADVRARPTLGPALDGVDTAYYLVHSMGSRGAFAAEDRMAARNFADAARVAGVRRIVYLGGLGRGRRLSSHLASRHEVGRILAGSGIPCLEFRAGPVVGSGSLSFEIVRALVRRLPVMVTPRWVRTMTQPIAAEDVIAYLLAALEQPEGARGVYEIGGPERMSYEGLMREYARQRGLERRVVRVPVLTPRVSSVWLGLVTPVYARVARKMIDGLRNETVVHDDSARRDFPHIRPRP